MARFIVKQPNGLYCIFGTIADDVLMYNLTRKELRDEVIKMMIHKAEQQIKEELQKPYMSFDDVRGSCRICTEEELSAHQKMFKEMGDENYSNLKIMEEEE